MSEQGDADLAYYRQLQGQVPNTTEPVRSMLDLERLRHFRESCIQWGWGEDEKGDRIRIPEIVEHPELLDTGEMRLSHLENLNDFTGEQAQVYYCRWRLIYHMHAMNYQATYDTKPFNLLLNLDTTIHGNVMGKMHEGSYMEFLAKMAGATRKVTIEQERKKRGLFNR